MVSTPPSLSKHTFYSLRRYYLTFMELMIALAIIGSIAGIIGINISKAVRQQRFRTEVALVVDQLRLAQNLMLILNEDVHVKFTQDKSRGVYSYELELQCALNKGWGKELTRKPRELRAIHELSFVEEGTSALSQRLQETLKFDFLSGGVVMSHGVLRLADTLGEERYIFLAGRPAPIAATGHAPNVFSLENAQQGRDNQLPLSTVQEVLGK